jgi:hypothetical protein
MIVCNIKLAQKMRFRTLADLEHIHIVKVSAVPRVVVNLHKTPLFLNFSIICSEPVLAN